MEVNRIPQMLTIKETAKITGLAEYFIRKLVNENKISFIKTGRKTLVNLEKLISFLNGETGMKTENTTNAKE